MSVQCELLELPARPAMTVRVTTAVDQLPQVIGQAYGLIMQYLAEQGEQPAGMPYVAYYNLDMQNLEVEMGFPVVRALPGCGEVQPGLLPAGRYAACFHYGPYESMAPTYDALNQWVVENGHQVTGVSYEFYYNNPAAVSPEEVKTEIWFPLKD